MKVTNYEFSTLPDLDQNLDLSHIDPAKTLIQIFSGRIKAIELQELIGIIKKKNSEAKFIGTTTAGEICNGGVFQHSIVVSVLEFDNVVVHEGYFFDENEFSMGEQIARSLFEDKTKAMFVFIDGLQTNGSNVIDGIASVNRDIPIAGGMSGDNGAFQNTFVFNSSGVYNQGAVAASLNGEELYVYTDYQLNWQPIGKTMTVTKAEGNRLYEVENTPIVDVYRKYLGDRIARGLPHSAIEFPLIKMMDDGMEICRTFVHKFDDGSLQTIGNIYEGDKVRFAFGNVSLVIESTKNSIDSLYQYYPEAIYTYSCASRITYMQSDVVMELEPLNKIAPIAGFFTYGEIFHRQSQNYLLNISLTILMLAEKQNQQSVCHLDSAQKSNQQKNFFDGKHFLVIEALTNLTGQVIRELESSNDEIRHQKERAEELHQQVEKSIDFASMIQRALLPDEKLFYQYFTESFYLWQPRDVVGGDICSIDELRHEDECLVVVADCTGHGVPGAFVTMIVKTMMRIIVADIVSSDNDVYPSAILQRFNRDIKALLKQDHQDSLSNVGMDAGVIYVDKRRKIVRFSGAEIPLFYFDDNGLKVIKGDRHSVGYRTSDADHVFKEHEIPLAGTMSFYLTSDGFIDQNGGEKGFPFGKKRFSKILEENHALSMVDMKEVLLDELGEWQDDEERNDDVTVLGFRLTSSGA